MSSRYASEQAIPPKDREDGAFSAMAGVAAWIWDPARNSAVYASAWRALLDLPADQALGRDIAWLWARISAEDREEFREACLACADGRAEGLDMLVRLECAFGSKRWALFRGSPVDAVGVDKPGRRISGIAIDVSHLRHDERFLSVAEEKDQAYRAILKHSPDFLIRFERPEGAVYANPVAAAHLGDPLGLRQAYERRDIRPLDDLFFRRHVKKVFETGRELKITASFPSSVKGWITGEFCFWPELTAGGRVVAVVCHMNDVTEHLRVEQEVLQNEQRFSAMHQLTLMLDGPEDEIIRFTVEQIVFLTQSPYGYLFLPGFGEQGKDRMIWSQSIHDLFESEQLPADRIPLDCFTKEFTCATDTPGSIINNRNDEFGTHAFLGRFAIKRFLLMPIIDDGRVVCIASVCNKANEYTDADLRQAELFLHGVWLTLRRRRHENALKMAKERAEQASRVKDEFLANISHELRTPLNGMLSMLQLLELAPLTGEQLEYARTASLSGKSLLRIISDILDFSRMASGKMSLQSSQFDLRGVLTSSMKLFAEDARQRGLAVSVSLDEALPPLLLGDEARVRQILVNLAGNAFKFTERGGVGLECSLLPYRTRDKVRVYFAVADTGVGIPAEAHSAVFDSFTQLQGKTGKHAGTGLGLSIVKQLVRSMGGSLTVESQENEGTTIHFSLPFALPGYSLAPVSPSLHEGVSRRLDILVAEDDAVGRFAALTFLKRIGHRAMCVNSGRQALEALQLYAFDCLMTDIQMPDMDGPEVARRIRQGDFADVRPTDDVAAMVRQAMPDARPQPGGIPRDLAIVAFTAHSMKGDRERFLRMGMDLYLPKPISMEDLRNVLGQVLHRNGNRRGSAN